MIKGVLFDMDGVLLDTERPSAMAVDLAVQRMGHKLPEDILAKMPGANEKFSQKLIVDYVGEGFDFPRFRELYHEENERLLAAQGGMALKKGVLQTLQWLNQQGVPICVASSTRMAKVQENLRRMNIWNFFNAAIGGDMIENSKPAPDIFLAAAKAINVPPAQCIAVEDSYNGVHSAASAGCVTVMIPDCTPANDDMRKTAAAVLGSMEDLQGFIENWECPQRAVYPRLRRG